MAWQRICKPKCFGGLVVKDLALQGSTSRVRWEWLNRTAKSGPWLGLPMIKDTATRQTFDCECRFRRSRVYLERVVFQFLES